jgi:hypothetical protein
VGVEIDYEVTDRKEVYYRKCGGSNL